MVDDGVQVIQTSGCLIEVSSGAIGFMYLKPIVVATVVGYPELVLGLGKRDDLCYAIQVILYCDVVIAPAVN